MRFGLLALIGMLGLGLAFVVQGLNARAQASGSDRNTGAPGFRGHCQSALMVAGIYALGWSAFGWQWKVKHPRQRVFLDRMSRFAPLMVGIAAYPVIPTIALAPALYPQFAGPVPPAPPTMGTFILLGPVVQGALFVALFVWILRTAKRNEAAEADGPLCEGCGYCLRGVGSATCPECGLEIPKHDGPAEPRRPDGAA